jgi:hypothetical protein
MGIMSHLSKPTDVSELYHGFPRGGGGGTREVSKYLWYIFISGV